MATLTPPRRSGLPPRYGHVSTPPEQGKKNNVIYSSALHVSPVNIPRMDSLTQRNRNSAKERKYSDPIRSSQNRDSSPVMSRNRPSRGRSPGPMGEHGTTLSPSPSIQSDSSEAWMNAPVPNYEENYHGSPGTAGVFPLLPPRSPAQFVNRGPSSNTRPPLISARAHSTSDLQIKSSSSSLSRPPSVKSKSRHRSFSPSVRSDASNLLRTQTDNSSLNANSVRPRARSNTPTTSRKRSCSRNKRGKSRSRSRSHSRVRGIAEKIFGISSSQDTRKASPVPLDSVFKRSPLTSSVFHKAESDLWIATINTNQKCEGGRHTTKYLRAFSYLTEREAKESALANAPPRMLPFDENPCCFICHEKFAIFKRAHHCRNCGVCICSSCSTTWPSRMIPETFNIKNAKVINVCVSCNWLSRAFKQALSKGEMDKVLALYSTGNLNLRCPFKNVKGETMFPVHCAVEGGNLRLLKWLVDAHHCPLRVIQTGNKNAAKIVTNPLLTSKGRSVVSVAMEDNKVDILRYLVVEKKMSVYETKDLSLALGMLDAVLKTPSEIDDENHTRIEGVSYSTEYNTGVQQSGQECRKTKISKVIQSNAPSSNFIEKNLNDMANSDVASEMEDVDDTKTVTTISDACILCYENSIDCVITPCGHQICCLRCSESLINCPVCNSEGSFIKIYKP